MMKIFKIAIVLMSLTLLLAVACSDRGTNVPDVPIEDQVSKWAVDPKLDHVFVNLPEEPDSLYQLRFQIRNNGAIQELGLYAPEESWNHGLRVPLLVLIPPMFESKSFFLDHGLYELIHEMTASGEIQPMTVVCFGSDRLFGGYFWGNSYPAGFYDEIIASPQPDGLVPWLNSTFKFLIDSPSKRGIGGVGMGAYGAYRAILKHPGMYSSISITDGPLDFDGADGNSGLISLFDDALTEQGLAPAEFKLFDSSSINPVTSMMISGALAFSPNDTLLVLDSIEIRSTVNSGDSAVAWIDTIYQMTDSTTLISDIVTADMGDWDFHLPFDQTLQPYAPIWSLWMNNDLESIHDAAGGTPLSGVNQWIATTPEAHLGYYQMTQSWISTLRNNGYSPEVKTYGGYEGKPASENQYIHDLLREMLIFHSENFGD